MGNFRETVRVSVFKSPDFLFPTLNLGGQFLADFPSRLRHGWPLISACRQKKRAAIFLVRNNCSKLIYSFLTNDLILSDHTNYFLFCCRYTFWSK